MWGRGPGGYMCDVVFPASAVPLFSVGDFGDPPHVFQVLGVLVFKEAVVWGASPVVWVCCSEVVHVFE